MFFFESKYKLSKIEKFLSGEGLSEDEFADLHHHSKSLVFTKLVDRYLDCLSSHSDKSYLLSLLSKNPDPDEIHNFLSIRVEHISFYTVISEVEDEVLLVLTSD